ncbi:MFS transporter [Streptomyces nitrosporeus]|uniref:MFS transporter n=1 Tax=Streptomyces nitrosporeus TaxID=28894 RepID=UPI00332D4042
MLPKRLLPASGPERLLAASTLVSSAGKGIFLTAGVLYLTRAVSLPAVQTGLLFSVAGLVSVLAGIPLGKTADRFGPRGVLWGSLGLSSLSALAFLLCRGYADSLLVVIAATVGQAGLLVARGPVINRIATRKAQELRAYIRAVTNAGIALGAAVAGWAAQQDTAQAYRVLVVVCAGCFAGALLIALRLPRLAPIPADRASRWAALGDCPYVVLSLLDGILSIQYRVLTVALPLWIVTATEAPRWSVSGAVVLNTVLVIALQVRVSRDVDTPERAGRAMTVAGMFLLGSCLALAATSGLPGEAAVVMLVIAVAAHSFGELKQAAGGFELSNTLAPPHAVGQYLGLFGMGMGLAESFGPALLTWLCIGWGWPGWCVMGVVFLLAGVAARPVVRWAERTRPATWAEPPRAAAV